MVLITDKAISLWLLSLIGSRLSLRFATRLLFCLLFLFLRKQLPLALLFCLLFGLHPLLFFLLGLLLLLLFFGKFSLLRSLIILRLHCLFSRSLLLL